MKSYKYYLCLFLFLFVYASFLSYLTTLAGIHPFIAFMIIYISLCYADKAIKECCA
jgi:hypothetical protein